MSSLVLGEDDGNADTETVVEIQDKLNINGKDLMVACQTLLYTFYGALTDFSERFICLAVNVNSSGYYLAMGGIFVINGINYIY